ncbi:V-type ATP synthase subunit A [Finegoldia magna]|uniref:V-type ATP synthase alpha chain n=2 Tax=Finegoldia magna TaxID=1260 RepID=A0A7D4FKE0_FINMA|nr:V-type ATP synthase subunit A [Finegoldia magna]EFL54147.1 ATP synthase ab domain protein [Finegoldia magna BVS033A4]EGS31876.1 V-type sodium ATPase, catalytic A subunit [Finegoldia magna SY403409CC001050417]MBS6928264.1 V-type ATP synthase subunit A [Finegoldia magna]MDU1213023.1 V-type ATP synthase subunit A [Finegoldia magna]MDU5441360.1 V-type ATP synthase subunit A [Finegoldia magna]
MNNGKIFSINGPVIKGRNMTDFTAKEMVLIGEKKLIGEVISLEDDIAVIQVYEETEGLKKDDEIYHTNKPLSLKLGPGLLKNMFDGIERPLKEIRDKFSTFIPEGIGLISIDEEKLWDVTIKVKNGDTVTQGQIIAEVPETEAIVHKIMIPVGVNGTVKNVLENGKYNIETTIMQVEDDFGNLTDIKLYQDWPIRIPRPSKERLDVDRLLETGQRILDVFFPLAKGGTVAIPGGFGTGKTMTQHQLAKYADADIIIYIGCGERGNEMTEVLEDFPKLIDPNNGKPLMERTVLIANTSNMPVAAREASIYTGITMAEYFRDMGYDVAIMADSTSRWAEALREISGRLEEMPAEEGYPAYLPSRIAQFYERAGIVKTLNDNEGSVTIIGAVSPAGGDFSEPVTENTKRFVNVFLGLDKDLAYSRHYPAINWMSSYSSYVDKLRDYYESKLGEDVVDLRNQMLKLLYEEDKLKEIVMLVGEDVLPDDQRLILDISNVMKLGFLQQNAFSKVDTYVPLKKQVEMLKTIKLLYEEGHKAIKEQIPISQVKNADLYSKVIAMKNTISNEDLSGIKDLNDEIKEFYSDLISKYEK